MRFRNMECILNISVIWQVLSFHSDQIFVSPSTKTLVSSLLPVIPLLSRLTIILETLETILTLCRERNGHHWAMKPTFLTKQTDNGTQVLLWTLVTDFLLNLEFLLRVLISSYINKSLNQIIPIFFLQPNHPLNL